MIRRSRSVTRAMLILVASLAWCTSATADTQELQRKPFLAVFDANGKKVGNVISLIVSESLFPSLGPGTMVMLPAVAFRVDTFVVALFVTQNRFTGNREILFESSDCSGPAFFQQVDPFFLGALPGAAVGSPGSTVYIPDPDGPVQSVAVQTALRPDSVCFNLGSLTTDAVPALPLIDLATMFTPPFSVR